MAARLAGQTGPGGAASSKMAIWAGGDEQIFNRHKPVLDAMGDQAAYIGPIGAGTIAKLVHNCTGAVMVWRSPRSLRWDQGREV